MAIACRTACQHDYVASHLRRARPLVQSGVVDVRLTRQEHTAATWHFHIALYHLTLGVSRVFSIVVVLGTIAKGR
jgi:hypothetical protein